MEQFFSARRSNMKEVREFIMKCVFLLTACVSIAAVVLICIFMFANGLPAIGKIGPLNFLLGEKWKPMNNIFGILPMIIGSIYVTAGAIIIGVPIAFFTSVYLAKFCNERLYKILKPAVELMAGIPSIVYGFFGLVVIVPIMQKVMGGSGKSVLTASVLLGIMILPTVIGVAESSIRAVPDSYYEGALALGATRERSVFFAVLPGAKSGILAGVVLGIGRAIGETMAVLMVTGNAAVIPTSFFEPVRTIPATIAAELGEAPAGGAHYQALFMLGAVLFLITLGLSIAVEYISSKRKI